MFEERWQIDHGTFKREYIIDRIRSIATVRTLSPEGYPKSIGDASKDLLNGELTPDKLTSRGYKLIQGGSL